MKLVKIAGEIAAAAKTLARHRCGALIIWDPAREIEGGIVLDARVSRQLLVAVHAPEQLNRLRTGVAVVRGSRVERAAVPLAWTDVVERAVELATGVAFLIDEDTGEIRRLDRSGQVDVVDTFRLATELHRHALGPRFP